MGRPDKAALKCAGKVRDRCPKLVRGAPLPCVKDAKLKTSINAHPAHPEHLKAKATIGSAEASSCVLFLFRI